MSVLENKLTQQLISATQKLNKSSEETTQTVQKIKEINASLVDITQKQQQVVKHVFSDGEEIKTLLSNSVKKASQTLTMLTETVTTMETEFGRIEESITLFDKIKESTLTLNKVARHTKVLALNTAVLGGSLGKDGNGIGVVAKEMQGLVKTCEEASKHIDSVVSSAKESVQQLIKNNRQYMQASLENTTTVEKALTTLITVVQGSKEDNSTTQPSVDSIITAVGTIEKLTHQVSQIVESTKAETEVLNNEIEVSNQAVSDLTGVVTNTPITNLSPQQALAQLSSFRIIDVRRTDEFNDQLGHIMRAKLCTITDENFKNKLKRLNHDAQYLFVCRSGGRSSKAARIAQSLGFPHIYNLEGGMLAWDKNQLPVEK